MWQHTLMTAINSGMHDYFH